MIPFPFNENRFSFFFFFFVVDHRLVGQLCTNPKSDRSLLSCLKGTQCSTREIGDAPLYNSCPLPIQVMTTGPLPAPSKCKPGRFKAWEHSSTHRKTLWRWWSRSPKLRTPPGRPGPRNSLKRFRQSLMKLPRTIAGTLKMQIRTVQRLRAQLNASDDPSDGYGYGLWCGFKWGPHHATSHLRSRLESQHQSVPECVVIPSCNQVAGDRPWVWQQDLAPAHWSKETQAWLQKECYDFVPFSHWPPAPPPTWTRWTASFGHTSRTSPTWSATTPKPSIRRAPADACGKDMLPVPDPYRSGDWGWWRLHWIDVSSTTLLTYLNWFFQ